MKSATAAKHRTSIDDCVETLCQQGCRTVTSIIQSLEQGLPVHGTEGLSRQEKTEVLNELKAIMSVYRCRPGSP